MLFQLIIIRCISIFIDKVIYHILDFLIRDKRPLDTHRLRITGRVKEHVTFPEQFLCAVHINDRPGIHS